MARINIQDNWWIDQRRKKLISLIGCEYKADGIALAFWRTAQEYWKKNKQLIPLEIFEIIEANSKLIEANIAKKTENGVYAVGSEENFHWLIKMRQNAKAGGDASAESRRKKTGSAQPKRRSKPEANASEFEANSTNIERSYSYSPSYSSSYSRSSSLDVASGENDAECNENVIAPPVGEGGPVKKLPLTAKVWEAYERAFEEKYKTKPIRNVTVNSQLASFVKRVGEDLAPEVIAFYVSHRASFYSQKMHPVGLALADAEKLAAEYNSGRMLTRANANKEDLVAANADLAAQIMRGE